MRFTRRQALAAMLVPSCAPSLLERPLQAEEVPASVEAAAAPFVRRYIVPKGEYSLKLLSDSPTPIAITAWDAQGSRIGQKSLDLVTGRSVEVGRFDLVSSVQEHTLTVESPGGKAFFGFLSYFEVPAPVAPKSLAARAARLASAQPPSSIAGFPVDE